MDIDNSVLLKKVLVQQVIYPMIKSISKEIADMVKSEMDKAQISTNTMQKYTTYSLQKDGNGYTSTIFVRDDLMQGEAEVGTYGVFNKFMSLDMKTSYYGKSISWRLVSWLEDGVRGNGNYIGNQPLNGVGMFANTYEKIKTQMPKMINEFASKYGVSILKG